MGYCRFPNLKKAVKEIPEIREYLRILKHFSKTKEQDMINLEQILINHNSEQLYGFLPRYMSIIVEVDYNDKR